jgi:hypothetical protein
VEGRSSSLERRRARYSAYHAIGARRFKGPRHQPGATRCPVSRVFEFALRHLAATQKKPITGAEVEAPVSLGRREAGGLCSR